MNVKTKRAGKWSTSTGSRRRFTRRRLLVASALGVAALGANGFWIEPNRIRVTEHVLGDAQSARASLRMVQLSDLHLQQVGWHEERIAETVRDLAPDLVLLSGDVIDRGDRLETLRTFLSLLPATSVTYAILGNWEHWARLDLGALERLYKAHAVNLLVNQSVRLEHEGVSVLLTGFDDATGGTPSVHDALDQVEPAPNHLLLAHSPVYRDTLERDAPPHRFAPEYMLSGHTHGGQINLLGWALIRPEGSGRYLRGWYRDRQPFLYVSQGLGTSVIPARFGAPPEIACFTWHLRA